MILVRINPARIYHIVFGAPLDKLRGLEFDFAFIFAKEIDRSRMSAEFFFEYMGRLWLDILRDGDPEDIIIIDDTRLKWLTKKNNAS
jgi:hypothetical protein